MKKEYLERLKTGKKLWNSWRDENSLSKSIDLSKSNLDGLNLSGYNLSHCNLENSSLIDTNLKSANLSHANCRKCRFIAANLTQAVLDGANLDSADFLTAIVIKISLKGLDLRKVNLDTFDLRGANLNKTNLSEKNLKGFDLRGCSLIGANLTATNLEAANLSNSDLTGATLERTNLYKANLSSASLTGVIAIGADFRNVLAESINLNSADLRGSDLNNAVLDKADLTGVKLAGANIESWTIKKVKCKDCCWDDRGQEFISFKRGEFERLYGAKLTLTLKYPDGIRPQELTTLPFLMEHLAASQWGCSIHLQSLNHSPGQTKVILAIDDMGDYEPTELLDALQQEVEQLQLAQFELRDNMSLSAELRTILASIKDRFWPRMLELAAEHQAAQNRHLTVMFMDLKGFSQWTEAEMASRLELFRGLLKPILNRWQASYPNMEGDSLRVTFHNASVAVKCALMVQSVLIAAGFSLRIGMDLGPVYVSQNAVTGIADLGGAALNFAARLEKSAEPGEVLVSERVKHFSRSIIDRYRFTQRDVILTKAVANFKAGAQVSCFKVEEIREP